MTDTQRPLTEEELNKIKAEAEEISARARLAAAEHDFFVRKAEAEAKKAEADALRAQVSLETEEFIRDNHKIARNQTVRQEQINLSGNIHHKLFEFAQEVEPRSVSTCIDTLSFWHRTEPGCDIEIRFTSPGGSMIAGFVLYDYIQELKRSGHKITTSTLGMAASMASILLQAGTVRVMGKEAWLVVHEGSLGVSGTAGEVEDSVKHMDRVRDRILNIYAEACERASDETATSRLSKAKIAQRWKRRDWYISSDEALAFGLVDTVR